MLRVNILLSLQMNIDDYRVTVETFDNLWEEERGIKSFEDGYETKNKN